MSIADRNAVCLLGHGVNDVEDWMAAGVDVPGSERTLELAVKEGSIENVGGRSVAKPATSSQTRAISRSATDCRPA